jgi:ABC-type nitrate/sulfonate/bicarbonate transport system permease component
MSNRLHRFFFALSRLLPLVLLVVVWQALGSFGLIDTAFLPTPAAVLAALVDLISGREIRDNLATTLMRAGSGLSLAAVCGIAFGFGMARLPAFRAIVTPIVGATYSLPKTAIVPLLILWFGIGHVMAVTAVYLSCLLPIIVHTYHGVAATPAVLVWSAQALGSGRARLAWRIFLPHALPEILTGLRIALGFSFVVAISAEMIASTTGIGRLVFMYGENGSYDYMFAALASVVFSAFVADRLLLAVSGFLLRWHDSAVALDDV